MKRLISVCVSLSILLLIYSRLDFDKLVGIWRTADVGLLCFALALVVPLAVLIGWRFSMLTARSGRLSVRESTKLVLSASVLNMVLPSKMGDLAKAVFITNKRLMSGSAAISLVTFEKMIDLLSLLIWCVFGLFFLVFVVGDTSEFFWVALACVFCGFLSLSVLLGSKSLSSLLFGAVQRRLPPKYGTKVGSIQVAWVNVQDFVRGERYAFFGIAAFSFGLWLLHLVQIWLFAVALRTDLPFADALALVPLAILAGLLPFTFAGVGTRDAALIYLLAPYMTPVQAAVMGVLCTLRYILPAIAGLPFFTTHLSELRLASKARKADRNGIAASPVSANTSEPTQSRVD